MKKSYLAPELHTEAFTSEDVITVSGFAVLQYVTGSIKDEELVKYDIDNMEFE